MTPSKKTQKEAFQRRVGFRVDAKIPLFCVGGDMAKEGFHILSTTIDGILGQGVQVVFVKQKNDDYSKFIAGLLKTSSAQVAVVDGNAAEVKRVFNVADVAMVFDDNSEAVKRAWKSKCVPLTHLGNVAIDYNPIEERGNGFVYRKGDAWSFFASFVRSCETYRFPYDWNTIVMGGVR
jgi:glycogen synthase